MSIADAQVRWMVPFILKQLSEQFEQSDIPIERLHPVAVVMNPGIGFTERETGVDYHALVYIAISDDQDAIRQLAQRLVPPGGKSAGPRQQ